MKKSKILFTAIFLLLLMAICCSCKKENKAEEMRQFYQSYATEYNVISEENDETVVSVNAPDFGKVILEWSKESNNKELTLEELEKAVEKYSEYQKDYQFTVETFSEENIKETFIDQVVYDMMKISLAEITIEEGAKG
ncbi:MAG: hypothetical protein UH241_07285 [Acutalibacteraceae bacterium]|nr:hypothetical protein [Acutalibacteraceae bacterium]